VFLFVPGFKEWRLVGSFICIELSTSTAYLTAKL
jgi:hypothetical protein